MSFNTFDNYFQKKIELPQEVEQLLLEENYQNLDRLIGSLLSSNGLLYRELAKFISIKEIEYLIAIREGGCDEDGIWHDDGSRDLAFTLSLTQNPEALDGGNLLLRKKQDSDKQPIRIPTAPFGTLTLIKTGKQGFEHRVERVKHGKRVICAGWIISC